MNIRALRNRLHSNENGIKFKDIRFDENGSYQYFAINDIVLSNLKDYGRITGFSLFQKEWTQLLVEPRTPYNLVDLITNIFLPAIDLTKAVLQSISNESITIVDVLKYFDSKHFLMGNLTDQIANELVGLTKMLHVDLNLNDLTDKIKCAIDMKQCSDQAKCILIAKEDLKLHGDFVTVTNVHEKVSIIYRHGKQVFSNTLYAFVILSFSIGLLRNY